MKSLFVNFAIPFTLLISGCRKVSQNDFSKKNQPITETNKLVDQQNLDDFEIICPISQEAFTNINEWRSYLSNCVTLDSVFVENIPAGKYLAVIQFEVTPGGKAINAKVIKDPGYGFGEKGLEIFNSYKGKWYFNIDEEPISNIHMRQPIFFEIE